MAKFHPTNQTLVGFAEGIIAPNEALLVSAHCDMCEQCESKVNAIVEVAADALFEQDSLTSNHIDNELGNMFDAIVSRPVCIGHSETTPISTSLNLNGKSFLIPSSL